MIDIKCVQCGNAITVADIKGLQVLRFNDSFYCSQCKQEILKVILETQNVGVKKPDEAELKPAEKEDNVPIVLLTEEVEEQVKEKVKKKTFALVTAAAVLTLALVGTIVYLVFLADDSAGKVKIVEVTERNNQPKNLRAEVRLSQLESRCPAGTQLFWFDAQTYSNPQPIGFVDIYPFRGEYTLKLVKGGYETIEAKVDVSKGTPTPSLDEILPGRMKPTKEFMETLEKAQKEYESGDIKTAYDCIERIRKWDPEYKDERFDVKTLAEQISAKFKFITALAPIQQDISEMIKRGNFEGVAIKLDELKTLAKNVGKEKDIADYVADQQQLIERIQNEMKSAAEEMKSGSLEKAKSHLSAAEKHSPLSPKVAELTAELDRIETQLASITRKLDEDSIVKAEEDLNEFEKRFKPKKTEEIRTAISSAKSLIDKIGRALAAMDTETARNVLENELKKISARSKETRNCEEDILACEAAKREIDDVSLYLQNWQIDLLEKKGVDADLVKKFRDILQMKKDLNNLEISIAIAPVSFTVTRNEIVCVAVMTVSVSNETGKLPENKVDIKIICKREGKDARLESFSKVN